jgi:uncharacterized membrane protein YuzA (DUF378 family)
MNTLSNKETVYYWRKKVEMITLLLIVVGGLNWGLVGLFNFNLVSFIAKHTFSWMETIVYILVGVSAILHIASRNYYLPFLGETAFPCNSMITKVPENANTEVKIETTPNSNVIYWATETHKEVMDNPWVAYEEFSNAGVARSDVNGVAILRFRTPSAYKVASFKTLSPHVHYRVCKSPGMLSEVKTVFTSQ